MMTDPTMGEFHFDFQNKHNAQDKPGQPQSDPQATQAFTPDWDKPGQLQQPQRPDVAPQNGRTDAPNTTGASVPPVSATSQATQAFTPDFGSQLGTPFDMPGMMSAQSPFVSSPMPASPITPSAAPTAPNTSAASPTGPTGQAAAAGLPTPGLPPVPLPTQAAPASNQFASSQPTQAMPTAPQPATSSSEETQAFVPDFAQTVNAAETATAAQIPPITPVQADQPTMAFTPGQPPEATATQALPSDAPGETVVFHPLDGAQPVQAPAEPAPSEAATQVFQPGMMDQIAAQNAAKPVTMPPSITPEDFYEDAGSGDGDGKEPGDGENGGEGDGRKKLSGGQIAGIVAAVVIVIALIVGGIFWFRSNSGDLTVASCQSAQSKYEESSKTLTDEAAKAKQTADGTTSTQVSDVNTLTTLNQAITDAAAITTDATCSADMNQSDLKTNVQKFKDAKKQADDQLATLKKAEEAVNSSKTTKTTDSLKNDLNGTISSAQNLLTSSDGQVQDDNTRTVLETAISNAKNVVNNSKSTDSDITNAKTQLQTAIDNVNTSITAKQEADKQAEEERRQQEEEQRRQQEQEQQQQQQETEGDGSSDGTDTGDGTGSGSDDAGTYSEDGTY